MTSLATARPDVLPVNNDFDILVNDAAVDGVLTDGLTLRGYIGATRTATTAINTLEVVLVARGGGSGDYVGTLLGGALASALVPTYLHTTVWVIAESNPAGSYRDAFPVVVVEDQSG